MRIDWADGKQSLLKLPDAPYTHLELVLTQNQVAPPEPVDVSASAAGAAAQQPAAVLPTVTDRAFDLVAGIVRDRFSAKPQDQVEPQAEPSVRPETPAAPAPQVDVTEQLHKLASLRDAGILTDDEFSTKTAELLARL